MWVNNDKYQVSVQLRESFNQKIREAFWKRNQDFEILETATPLKPAEIAYMHFDGATGKISFRCGTFWNDFENIIPVIAMAHELGHYIDLTENFSGDIHLYHKKLGILELETRAWLKAVDVCKEIGLEMWNVFFKYAKQCLESYFSMKTCFPQDIRFGFFGKPPTFNQALSRLKSSVKKALTVENTPYKRMMLKKIEARRQLKSYLGMKPWE